MNQNRFILEIGKSLQPQIRPHDLVRARESANDALKKTRQHLQAFLLRHGRIYTGRTPWTRAHTRWLAAQSLTHPALHIVLAKYIQAIEDAGVRLERLTKQVAETAATWSMAPVVDAYQAMRGIAFISAVTFVVEIGDVRRFETAPQLMAYLGLVPTESSTGERVKRGGITKAGNTVGCRPPVRNPRKRYGQIIYSRPTTDRGSLRRTYGNALPTRG